MNGGRLTATLIGSLDGRRSSLLLKTAGDLVLVLDEAGTVVDLAVSDEGLDLALVSAWRGQSWEQTVTVESRPKVRELLQDALSAAGASRWRQLNHPAGEGAGDLPLLYAAVHLPAGAGGRAATSGRVVAIGRSMGDTVRLQQRLVQAQQVLERDYWRFREAETRYRHLFQSSSEAVLIVDGTSLKVLEANPAARTLLGESRGRIIGATLVSLFSAAGADSLQALVAGARTVGRRDLQPLQLADGVTPVAVGASLFRQDDAALLLVRLLPQGAVEGGAPAPESSGPEALFQIFVQQAADAMVFTDLTGKVLRGNRAFATLVQAGDDRAVVGQSLDRWVGRTGVELGVLITSLRQRGTAGLFTTVVRDSFGGSTEVEISACLLAQGETSALAFVMRNIDRRPRTEGSAVGAVGASRSRSRSVDELAELVGSVPLKQIVSETTDLIEQLCVETALRMTGDKRASAALLLGLSRQSLYVKLRRFGMAADVVTEDEV